MITEFLTHGLPLYIVHSIAENLSHTSSDGPYLKFNLCFFLHWLRKCRSLGQDASERLTPGPGPGAMWYTWIVLEVAEGFISSSGTGSALTSQ